MKNGNGRKKLRWIAAALGAYLALLGLLAWIEGAREGATITTLPKALWYSLVTLTTVGYGDLYPVTLPGKLIGGLFLILSTGLLALLVGLVYAAVTGRLLPRIRLWLDRRRKWYVFSPDNEAARALAGRLDDGVAVFCRSASDRRDGNGLCLRMGPEALFELPLAGEGERVFFAVDGDPSVNEGVSLALRDRPVRIWCRADLPGEGLPENITPFNECECTARLYWQTRPWRPSGERVAVIGGGRFARALLNQGLLTAPPGCSVSLFGDWALWRGLHRAVLELRAPAVALSFQAGDWHDCADILRDADRIVLCDDDRRTNARTLRLLRQYCVVRGQIDARCEPGLQDAFCFGEPESLFTPELVMKQAQDRLGRHLHEMYRSQADYPVPTWEALSDFLRRSNLAAADHLLTKLRLLLPEKDVREITPENCALAADRYEALSPEERERCRIIEHDRWMLFHALYGWRYAAIRNNAEREHPLMVDYEELSESDREKDDNAWNQIRALAEGGAL